MIPVSRAVQRIFSGLLRQTDVINPDPRGTGRILDLPKWRNGRRTRLKIWRPRGRVGSSPTFGTILKLKKREISFVSAPHSLFLHFRGFRLIAGRHGREKKGIAYPIPARMSCGEAGVVKRACVIFFSRNKKKTQSGQIFSDFET